MGVTHIVNIIVTMKPRDCCFSAMLTSRRGLRCFEQFMKVTDGSSDD